MIDTLDEEFIEEALKEAELATQNGNYGIGAVIVLDGEIISRSGNEIVTRDIAYYAHAENLALDKLRETEFDKPSLYREMTVYTTLSPCPMCWGRILVAGISRVVYGWLDKPSTQEYDYTVPEIFKQTEPAIEEVGGDLGDRCRKIFEDTREECDEKFFSALV